MYSKLYIGNDSELWLFIHIVVVSVIAGVCCRRFHWRPHPAFTCTRIQKCPSTFKSSMSQSQTPPLRKEWSTLYALWSAQYAACHDMT